MSKWKSKSTLSSWTSDLGKSNAEYRKPSSSVFYFGTDVAGKDTMGTRRPSGMSTIIKSTPTPVLCIPLKA
jgi:hypothetical protein